MGAMVNGQKMNRWTPIGTPINGTPVDPRHKIKPVPNQEESQLKIDRLTRPVTAKLEDS